MAAVSCVGLSKSYGSAEAVRGVDLEVAAGEVFALLGPNGAGKTTTVEILEGYRRRDAGVVSVLGHDPANPSPAFKRRIGIVLQSTGVQPYLTVAETLAMYASYYPSPRSVDELVHLVGLRDQLGVRVERLSGGQQRRLDVAIGLAGDPDLLFLDEPTTGFDPSARREAWEVVRNLAALGKTVLLTTHYMDEAQALADRVAVMVAGRVVAVGTPATLASRDSAAARILVRLPPGAVPPGELHGFPAADGLTEFVPADLARGLHALTGWALDLGICLDSLQVIRPSLEDVYLQLTGSAAASVPGRDSSEGS